MTADEPHDRYQVVIEAPSSRRATYAACTDASPRPTGQRLFQSFVRRPDAYLDH